MTWEVNYLYGVCCPQWHDKLTIYTVFVVLNDMISLLFIWCLLSSIAWEVYYLYRVCSPQWHEKFTIYMVFVVLNDMRSLLFIWCLLSSMAWEINYLYAVCYPQWPEKLTIYMLSVAWEIVICLSVWIKKTISTENNQENEVVCLLHLKSVLNMNYLQCPMAFHTNHLGSYDYKNSTKTRNNFNTPIYISIKMCSLK